MAREVYSIRFEPELWKALEEEAERRGVTARVLLRALAIKVSGFDPAPKPKTAEELLKPN